jgi:YHS domain-containing protein
MYGMQVRTADAPATAVHEGQRQYFCSDHCRHRFLARAGVRSQE